MWDLQQLHRCGQQRYFVNHIDFQIAFKALLSLSLATCFPHIIVIHFINVDHYQCLSSPASTATTAKCLENCQDPTGLTTKIRSANTESWQTTREMWHIGFRIGQMNTNQLQEEWEDDCISKRHPESWIIFLPPWHNLKMKICCYFMVTVKAYKVEKLCKF